MSKLIKIKESEVFRVITKIINEEVVGEIKVTATNDLGTHPEFKGLKTLLAQLKSNVQTALRGKLPYRIKSNGDDGTVRPIKQGNALGLEVTLIPCEPSKRDWFFDGAAAIYTYINTTSFSLVEGKVRMAAMDKAKNSFIGSQPQELYPNHIGLGKFTGLNTVEPDKKYQLILKFLVGSRPGGFYDVDDDEIDTQKKSNQGSALKNVESMKEGFVLYAIRSTDNQKYKLVIGKLMQNYNGFPAVYITGPGTYEGKKLDGTAPYDLVPSTENPLELHGNTEMGSFKLINFSPEDQPVANTAASTAAVTSPDRKAQASSAAAATVTSSDKKTEATNESGKPVSAGWEGANIDDAHNVKPFIADIQKGLEDFWKSGKNPIVEDIEMTVSKNANGSYTTKTKANIKESKDGMAWVGFESRGSAGEGYKERADDQYNGGRYDDKGRPVLKDGKQVNKGQTANKKDGTPNPCYGKSLAKCMQDHVGAGEVKLVATIEDVSIPFKQYFVTFTKPQNFPPK
jgi:hypothetical protein